MRYQDVVAAYAAVAQADRACERSYLISDRAVVRIHLESLYGKPEDIQVRIRPVLLKNETEDSCGSMHISSLTPAELVRIAEIRSMVDDWVNGKCDDMPASTAPPSFRTYDCPDVRPLGAKS